MTNRLRILHISDLHEREIASGMKPERVSQIEGGRAARYRVLGTNFLEVLADIQREHPVDIVCFTGDIADWGLPEEYVAADTRIRGLLKAVNLPFDRFFLVPGNHDIHRETAKTDWREMRRLAGDRPDLLSTWMRGGNKPHGSRSQRRDNTLSRSLAFWDWVDGTLGRSDLLPAKNPHRRLGYRSSRTLNGLPFDIHVIGLDSSWLCGDKDDARKICLTSHQIDLLAYDRGKELPGFRIALVHHPLSDLSDESCCRTLLSGTVDVLLHGHIHESTTHLSEDPDRRLLCLAAGSLYEGDQEDKWVNGFNVIDVCLSDEGRPIRFDVEFYGWSPTGQFWHRDNSVYKNAKDGKISWSPKSGFISPASSPRANNAELLTPAEKNPFMAAQIPDAAAVNSAVHLSSFNVPQPTGDTYPIVPAIHSSLSINFANTIAHLAEMKAISEAASSLGVTSSTLLSTTRQSAPPPPPIDFVSRPDIVESIENELKTNRVLAVFGYEECGKSIAVSEYARKFDKCFWYSAPQTGARDGVLDILLFLPLSVFLGCNSIAIADIQTTLQRYLASSRLLIVIDDAHAFTELASLEFLFEIAHANANLVVLLIGTDLPDFKRKMHELNIQTWRIPGMAANQAIELFCKRGVEVTELRSGAVSILCACCDGHVGMLRLSTNAVNAVVDERTFAGFLTSANGIVATKASVFYDKLVHSFIEELSDNMATMCRQLSVAFSPFSERLAYSLWTVDGDETLFYPTWYRCLAGVFEPHDRGRFSIPSLYQNGLQGRCNRDELRRWHAVAAAVLSKPDGNTFNLYDVCDAIWHYIAAESFDVGISTFCSLLALAHRDRRLDAVKYLSNRFDTLLETFIGQPSVTRRTRTQWYGIKTLFYGEFGDHESESQAANSLFTVLCERTSGESDVGYESIAWARLLVHGTTTGNHALAVAAYRALSPESRRVFRRKRRNVAPILVLSAFVTSGTSALEFVYEVAFAPEPNAVQLNDLFAERTDYELWRCLLAAIYDDLMRKKDNHESTDEEMRMLREIYDAMRAAGVIDLAILVAACNVRLIIDLERDFAKAEEFGHEMITLIQPGLSSRVCAHAHQLFGDALRCTGKSPLAESEYASAIQLLSTNDRSDRFEATLLLGITRSLNGNRRNGYRLAVEASHIASEDMPRQSARALLEGFAIAFSDERPAQSLQCLIESHRVLYAHRDWPEWVALGQCAMALSSSINETPAPRPGFTLGLPSVISGSDKMWPAAPTVMVALACSKLGRPNRALSFFDQASSEATDSNSRMHIAFLGYNPALAVKDLRRATLSALTALGLENNLSAVEPVMLSEFLLGGVIRLAAEICSGQCDRDILDSAIQVQEEGFSGMDGSATLMFDCLRAMRNSLESGITDQLKEVYDSAISRKAFNLARDIAWWCCFRPLWGRSVMVAELFRWHWRLSWLTSAVKYDEAYCTNYLEQECYTWSQFTSSEHKQLLSNLLAILNNTESDPADKITTLSDQLCSNWIKHDDLEPILIELIYSIQMCPHPLCYSTTSQTLILSVLDLLLRPENFTLSDDTFDALDRLGDLLKSTNNSDDNYVAQFVVSIKNIKSIRHALKNNIISKEAVDAIVAFHDVAKDLSAASEANWFLACHQLCSFVNVDLATFRKVDEILRSDRVELLIGRSDIPDGLQKRLAACSASSVGRQANLCIRELCTVITVQWRFRQARDLSAIADTHRKMDQACALARSCALILDECETYFRSCIGGEADVYSCCFQRGVLRKAAGASFCQVLRRSDLGKKWLERALEDFRSAVDAAKDLDDQSKVFHGACEAYTIAEYGKDSIEASKWRKMMDNANAHLTDDLRIEIDLHNDALIGNYEKRSWYPEDDTQANEFADRLMDYLELPANRRYYVMEYAKKLEKVGKVRRGYCQHLEVMDSSNDFQSLSTAFLRPSSFTGFCSLLNLRTALEVEDIELALETMKRMYCAECDKRSPLTPPPPSY